MGIEASIMQMILSGKKTIEGRLRTPKFVTLRSGDIISFREDIWGNDRLVSSIPKKAKAKITKTQFFDSFQNMFEVVDYRLALPSASSALEATSVYRRFYTDEQESEHGVVAITFELLA